MARAEICNRAARRRNERRPIHRVGDDAGSLSAQDHDSLLRQRLEDQPAADELDSRMGMGGFNRRTCARGTSASFASLGQLCNS
jgi:hypothetical protein